MVRMSLLKGIMRQSVLLIVLVSMVAIGGLITTPSAHAATGNGSPQDPNVKFIGRWDTTTSTTTFTSFWAGTYLKTSFTGKTVKIKLAQSVNIYSSIDGSPVVLHVGANGTFNLTPTPLTTGTHTLMVAARSGSIAFQGLVLDPGATTVAPNISPKLMEFVGDSITAGFTDTNLALSDYAWLVSEQLHVQHTQIAQSGICLVGQTGCFAMNTQFFKLGTIHDINTPNWDFTRYQANAVVINLGTNDNGHRVTKPTFQAAYTQFMRDIRAKYPNAVIFAFETLRTVYKTETQAAVAARNAAGDSRVHFINTENWLVASDFSADGGHPNDTGQMKIAAKLAPILIPALQ